MPEKDVSAVLSSFSCERDKDVESFLRDKAVVQEKKHVSRTYLIVSNGEEPELMAYFALAVSSMEGDDLRCSNSMRKKMNISGGLAMSYLIGQLGKRDGSAKGLGKFAIEVAMGYILDANAKVGCRVIRIDCKPSLISYYENNGFTFVGCNEEGNLSLMVRIIETNAVRT